MSNSNNIKSPIAPNKKTENDEKDEYKEKKKSRGGWMKMLQNVVWGQKATDSTLSESTPSSLPAADLRLLLYTCKGNYVVMPRA